MRYSPGLIASSCRALHQPGPSRSTRIDQKSACGAEIPFLFVVALPAPDHLFPQPCNYS